MPDKFNGTGVLFRRSAIVPNINARSNEILSEFKS